MAGMSTATVTRVRRAAIYVRISRDKRVGTDGEGLGVARQAEDCRAHLAKRADWTEAGYYEDNDKSAIGKKPRDEYNRLIRDIRAGLIDVVIVWTSERLYKRRIDQAIFLDLGKRHEIVLSLVRGGDIDMSTPTGRFIADQLASQARLETEMKSDRQHREGLQNAQRGEPHRGRRAFGFQADGIAHNPVEARAVKKMYDDSVNGVPNLSKMARELNDGTWNGGNPIPLSSPRGIPWTHKSVRSVLQNPRNAGLRGYTRTSIDEETGERINAPTQIIGPGKWEGIVTEDVFEAVQRRLEQSDRKTNYVGAARVWLLSGLAYCGVCNDGTRVRSGGRSGKVPIYRCLKSAHLSRAAGFCDTMVERAAIRLIENSGPEILAATEGPDQTDIRTELAAIEIQLSGVYDLIDGRPDRMVKARATLERLEGEQERLRAALDVQARHPDIEALIGSSDVPAAWAGLSLARRRAVVERLVVVTVLPGQRGQHQRPETVSIVPTWA